MITRIAFKMKLKPGCEAEYQKRHNDLWPELKQMLKDSGVSEYSIFWDKETNILFAVQKLAGEVSSQDLGPTPIVQKWWDFMSDIMETHPDHSPISTPLTELFYLE